MTDEAVPPDNSRPLDCLIVGGGPAGLTAAIYLARFHRRVTVVDKAEGRLQMIPRTRNHPGYPQGVTGSQLLADMREQAVQYGASLLTGEVTALRRDGDLIVADTGQGEMKARTVLLATGVVNHRPPVDEETHADAVARGLLRYCPICDAFEQTGKRIGVLGGDRHALAEALFLRTYSRDVTCVALSHVELTADEHAQADQARITVLDSPMSALQFKDSSVEVTLADGDHVTFDTLYVALGSHTRNDLGAMLGTDLENGQCFVTDDHQHTTVPRVYAAGDAVEGLDQIGVAIGTGARAAVAIHNDLRKEDGHTLPG
ncbi:NAD(P)/FAD-dependent oxidoreductase [Paracoccus salipaludis]|uniref:Thioredoxin reductase n=1 Tax=Paracoccus salipaludis TaxID=2032623 RepID=A0A2A2GJY7_9RHOB|nr:NAD(P)/FAD-dependent oxidoreductase [Paracoccus salipaludis]PAU97213.1 thioredoxin reductase [Paracoccus salipaludis]